MDRIELIEKLGEPFDSLAEEVRGMALALSKTDSEVGRAVEFSRFLSRSHGADLYAEPKTSDAEFLVILRNRITSRSTVRYVPLFLKGKAVAVVTSTCVVLLVAVIMGGRYSSPSSVDVVSPGQIYSYGSQDRVMADNEISPTTRSSSEIDLEAAAAKDETSGETTAIPVDSLTDAGVDPLELAAYLNVSDMTEEMETTDEDTLPLTDQLLTLDTGTLEEVLNDLNETTFF